MYRIREGKPKRYWLGIAMLFIGVWGALLGTIGIGAYLAFSEWVFTPTSVGLGFCCGLLIVGGWKLIRE